MVLKLGAVVKHMGREYRLISNGVEVNSWGSQDFYVGTPLDDIDKKKVCFYCEFKLRQPASFWSRLKHFFRK